MWAQLSTFRVREGKVDDLTRAMEQLRTFEQPDSGLLRTIAMQDQLDASRVFMFVMFESEERPERARATRDAKTAFKRYALTLPRFSKDRPNSPI
jgi:hypothetical protein